VHGADIQDRDGAKGVLKRSRARFPFVARAYGDGGYAGRLVRWAKRQTHIILEVVKRNSEQTGFAVIRRRWVVEIVFTQLTKADVLALRAGGQHIANFDLGLCYNHAIHEQQHKLSALLESGICQPMLHPPAKGLQGGRHAGKLLLALRIVTQELPLASQRLHALLQVAAAPLILIEREDRP